MNIASDKQTAVFLYQLAGMIEHRKFIPLLSDTTNRFSEKAPFMGRVLLASGETVLDSLKIASTRSYGDYRGLSLQSPSNELEVLVSDVAQRLRRVANTLDDSILKREQQFKVPRARNFLDVANDTFGFMLGESFRYAINEMSSPNRERYKLNIDFRYINDLIFNIASHMCMRDTLTKPTGHATFETIIKHAIAKGEDYWLCGYPSDLLVHDINTIRANRGVKLIALKDDVLSTFAVIDESDDYYQRSYDITFRITQAKAA